MFFSSVEHEAIIGVSIMIYIGAHDNEQIRLSSQHEATFLFSFPITHPCWQVLSNSEQFPHSLVHPNLSLLLNTSHIRHTVHKRPPFLTVSIY